MEVVPRSNISRDIVELRDDAIGQFVQDLVFSLTMSWLDTVESLLVGAIG